MLFAKDEQGEIIRIRSELFEYEKGYFTYTCPECGTELILVKGYIKKDYLQPGFNDDDEREHAHIAHFRHKDMNKKCRYSVLPYDAGLKQVISTLKEDLLEKVAPDEEILDYITGHRADKVVYCYVTDQRPHLFKYEFVCDKIIDYFQRMLSMTRKEILNLEKFYEKNKIERDFVIETKKMWLKYYKRAKELRRDYFDDIEWTDVRYLKDERQRSFGGNNYEWEKI